MEIFSISNLDLEVPALSKKFRTDAATMDRLVHSVTRVMDVKAAFRTCYLEAKEKDAVTIEGIRFSSRVLARNLSGVGKVFPFVLTLGKGVDTLIDAASDILEKYLLDEIGNVLLKASRKKFENHLLQSSAFHKLSFMAPGALADWPIEEQKKLFALLKDMESAVFVRLTDRCLMIPRKSVSGIYFPSEATFFSCQLCPRERCDSRKAPLDEAKARAYGIRARPVRTLPRALAGRGDKRLRDP